MINKYKPPHIIVLLFLQAFIACLVYGANVFLREIIADSSTAFLIYSFMLMIASTLAGAVWISGTKCYTLESFCDSMVNERDCEHVIYLCGRRIKELKTVIK